MTNDNFDQMLDAIIKARHDAILVQQIRMV